MPENPYRQVNGPQGPINFPSTMSDMEVTQAMRKLYPPKQAPSTPEAAAGPMLTKLGSYLPDWSMPAMQAVKKYAVDPFEHITQKGAELGGAAGEYAGRYGVPMTGFHGAGDVGAGIGKGIGETVGGVVADPRNWPMMGAAEARPILQTIMKRGFSAMMAKGTFDSAKNLYDNWDKLTPGQRAEGITQTGLSGAMTAGVLASKGEPAPKDVPIAASGKTEGELKAASVAQNSPPKTGLANKPVPALSADEIKIRIKAIEDKMAAAKPKPAGEDAVEQARRRAPEPQQVTPAPNQVPEKQRASTVIPAQEQAKMAARIEGRTVEKKAIEAPLPRAPEARPEPTPAERELSQLRQQRTQETENLKLGLNPDGSLTVRPHPEIWKAAGTQPEGSTVRAFAEERARTLQERIDTGKVPPEAAPDKALAPKGLVAKQAAMKVRQDAINAKQTEAEQYIQTHRAAEANRVAELRKENEALRQTVSPKVGGEAAPPEASKPEVKPVPSAQETARSGEPVRGPEVAKVEGEPRSSRGQESKATELGAREPQPPAAPAQPRDFQKEMEVYRQRVEKYQQDNPGVSKSHAQGIVAEQLRKERGSVGGSPDDRQGRREEKIKNWVQQIRDPKSDEATYTTAYKMLKAYGLEDDEILRRVSVAEGFAETGKSPIEERLGPDAKADAEADRLLGESRPGVGGIMDQVDRVMDKHESTADWINKLTPEERGAIREGYAVGKPEIHGVKDPQVEDLERLYGLKDDRGESRFPRPDDKERGSVSFKRLSLAQQAAANPLRRLADALDRVAGFIEHGRMTDEEVGRAQQTKNIIRKAGAELARSHSEVMEALKDAIQRHDSPTNERKNFIQFMDAGEGKPGAKFLAPEDQALSKALHEMFEERWEKIKEVKGLEGEGIENYLSHIWEKPNKAGKVLSGISTGRRPLEGNAKFLKNRFYQYASTGVAHGLTPATWNPIRLQLAALFETDKFLMAHDIKDQFKDAGLVKWTQLSDYKNVPAGWQRLDDKIFQPKLGGDGALKEYGTYYAPGEVAKVFNNYLSPGMRGNSTLGGAYSALRNYANTLNMATLGISGYHGTMISLVSATSDLALGLQRVLNYGDIGGMKDMLRGSVGTFILRSAARDYKLGRAIEGEAISPTGDPGLQKYVDALMKGGGRVKQDPFYTNTIAERKGFVNWLKLAPQGKFQEMALTGVQKLSGPIMDKYVPRVKLGVAARMMEAKLADLQKNGINDENTVATEMGKIWDSVDNRAGQMVYDNLFWNKMAKDLSFLAVRAAGWDLGSVREYGGGLGIDLPRQAAKALRGERPELTSRLAFTIATPITIGMFGGMLHYVMTGKAPQKTEDYFFPGPDGAKISFPSYMKDYFAFKDHPGRTVVNKLNPVWGQMSDLYSNSDFYGNEIRHPGDDKLKQGWDVMKYTGKSFVPFSFTGIAKRIERGDPVSSSTSSFFGFMPAPLEVGQTKAENLAVDLARRSWQSGPRTTSDTDRYALVQKFQRQVGEGHLDPEEFRKAWTDKKIQDTDVAKIYGNFKIPKLQREFKELTLPDALAVMREADPNERVQLKPLLLEKYGQLERYPLDQQKAYDLQIKAYLQ